jgi:HEAT repeat protein
MGEKAATNEVIAGLLHALRDEDSYVRKNASEALGKMGEQAARHEVIAGLLHALRDED